MIPVALELLIVVALGALLLSILMRLLGGRLHAPACSNCNRPRSRAYPRCRHCGFER